MTVAVVMAVAGFGAAFLVGPSLAAHNGSSTCFGDSPATGPASAGATSATLTGTITGCPGDTVSYAFGYGTTSSVNADAGCNGYDSYTPTQSATVGDSGSVPVSAAVGGLAPKTTYYYQLCFPGKGYYGSGDEMTFTTGSGSSAPPKPPEDPHADLAVSVSADRANAAVGDTLTYTVEVRNWGPREATNVTLTDVLPAQVQFVSVSSSAPPTARRLQDAVGCSGGATVVCRIGVLGYGSSSTTTIVTRVVAAGEAIDTASVSNPDQPDPNGANSTGATTVAVATPTPTTTTGGSAPPPVYGQTFDIRPVSGTVLVRLPGTTTFVPLTSLTSIPEGSEIDTTNGRVEITSASDPGNDTQTAQFYSGRFVLLYAPPDIGKAPQVPGTVTTLVTSLVLSAPLDCATTRHSANAQAKKKVRFLWGTGKGNFRTRGRYAAATVRGTIWFTEDTCTTTTVHVVRGVVDVYDVVLNKHFLVHAGQSHTSHRRP